MAKFEADVEEDAFVVTFFFRTTFFLVPFPSPAPEAVTFFFLTVFFFVVVGALEVSPVAEVPPEAPGGPPAAMLAPGAGAPVVPVVLDGADDIAVQIIECFSSAKKWLYLLVDQVIGTSS